MEGRKRREEDPPIFGGDPNLPRARHRESFIGEILFLSKREKCKGLGFSIMLASLRSSWKCNKITRNEILIYLISYRLKVSLFVER